MKSPKKLLILVFTINICCSLHKLNLTWIQSNINVTTQQSAFIGYDEEEEVIKIMGGRFSSTTLVEYNTRTQSTTITNPGPSYYYCYAQCWTQIGNALYILSDDGSNRMNLFNLTSNTFTQQLPNNYPSDSLEYRCVTHFDDEYIVVAGGYYLATRYDGVLLYNLLTNQWSNAPNLLSANYGAACNVAQNKLFVIGGYIGITPYLDTVDVISTSNLITNTNSWSTIGSKLSQGKMYTRTAVYANSIIYVVGGWTGAMSSNTVDIIYADTETIVQDNNILNVNEYQQIMIIDDILYSFGGTDSPQKYQFAVIPTFNPTKSPSKLPTTITENPTYSPSNSPSSSPSNGPTSSPSTDPTEAPSFSPTQFPTKADAFSQQIAVIYTVYNLNDENVELNLDLDGIIVPIIRKVYVQTAPQIVDEKENYTLLEYRDFDIIVKEDDITQHKHYDLSMTSTLYYQENSTQQLITFISNKDTFITTIETELRYYFNNQIIEFSVNFPPPSNNSTGTTSKAFNYFVAALVTMLVISCLISFGAFYFNKLEQTSIDNGKYLVVIIFGIQFYDFVTDINLSIEILSEIILNGNNSVVLLIAGYGSVIFLVFPYLINILIAVNIEHWIHQNQFAQIYFKQKRNLFLFLVAFTGSTHSVLNLLSSRIFALNIFNNGLTDYEIQQLSKMKCYAKVIAESMPQLICQVLYVLHSTKASEAAILSFTASFLSILTSILSYFMEYRSYADASNTVVVHYDLKCYCKSNKLLDNDKNQIVQKKECKNAMRKQLCSSLDVAESMIEIGFVHQINNGFIMHIVHFLFKNQLNSLNIHHENAKQFTTKLYATKKQEVNDAFMNHFDFDEEFVVDYFHQIGYKELFGDSFSVIELKTDFKPSKPNKSDGAYHLLSD